MTAVKDAIRRAAQEATVHAIGPTGAVVLDPNDPRPSARLFIEREYTSDGFVTIWEQSGVPYVWSGTHYREAEWTEIRSQVWGFAEKAERWDGGKDPALVPFQPTPRKVSAIEDAIRSLTYLSPERAAPCWL